MYIKKNRGKVYGAVMSAAEKKAMDMEIQKQLAEYDRKHAFEIDALILWVIRQVFGFGPIKLKRFYMRFHKEINALIERYELDDSNKIWLCTYMLKQEGIDIEEWRREAGYEMEPGWKGKVR